MATIRKRTWQAKDGTRTAWVVDYRDQGGTRRLKTFDRKKDADAFMVDARHEVTQGIYTADSASATVAEAADLWLKRAELEGLEPSTVKGYREHAERHIKPLIGGLKLSRLTTPAVQAFRDQLLETRSRPMAKKVLGSLKAIVAEAQRRGLVAHNAARSVSIRTPGRDKQRAEIPTREEVQALIEAAEGRWRAFVLVAVFTGLRASELRGLRWEDVDFDAKVIRVRQRADAWGTIGSLKSESGLRDVPMTPMVANVLKEWRLACPGVGTVKDEKGNIIEPGELALVFPNGKGRVELHGNVVKRGFGPLQVAAGVADPVLGEGGEPIKDAEGKPVLRPRYGLHALRHFYASWLIDQGFPPKRVQALLGHASIQMTFDVYGHLFPAEADDHARLAAGELKLVNGA